MLCQRIGKAAQQQLQLCSRHGFQYLVHSLLAESAVWQLSLPAVLASPVNCTCGVEAPLARLVDDCLPRLRIQLLDDIPAGLAASEHPATGPLRPDARACSTRRVKIHDSLNDNVNLKRPQTLPASQLQHQHWHHTPAPHIRATMNNPVLTDLFGAPLLVRRQVQEVGAVPLARVDDGHAHLPRRRQHPPAGCLITILVTRRECPDECRKRGSCCYLSLWVGFGAVACWERLQDAAGAQRPHCVTGTESVLDGLDGRSHERQVVAHLINIPTLAAEVYLQTQAEAGHAWPL